MRRDLLTCEGGLRSASCPRPSRRQGSAPGPGPPTPSPPGSREEAPCPSRLPISASPPLSCRDIDGNQKQHHGERCPPPRGEPPHPGGRARAGPGRGGRGGGLGVLEPAPALPALRRYRAGRRPVAGVCRVGVSILAVLCEGSAPLGCGLAVFTSEWGFVAVVWARGSRHQLAGLGRVGRPPNRRAGWSSRPPVPTRLAVGSWPHRADPGSSRFVHVM